MRGLAVFIEHAEFEGHRRVGHERSASIALPDDAAAIGKLSDIGIFRGRIELRAYPERIITGKRPGLVYRRRKVELSNQSPGKAVFIYDISEDLVVACGHRRQILREDTWLSLNLFGMKVPHMIQSGKANQEQMHEMVVVGNQLPQLDLMVPLIALAFC